MGGAEIAQLVERPTKYPGAILMRVESQVQQGIFLPESTSTSSSADSFMVFIQTPNAITRISICMHVKNPKHWQLHHCLDTQKYYTH